jgi:hypothetical protein
LLSQKQLYQVLKFPKHLQISAISLLKMDLASAEQVAEVTGKARAMESAYLNQLAIMRIVRKEHNRRRVFFCVDLEALDW